MKHMLIMRATQKAVEDYANMDFEAVINAMGAYNESMMKAGVSNQVSGRFASDMP